MKSQEFLSSLPNQISGHTERLLLAIQGLTNDELNTQPEPGVWSCAQVIQHLNLANTPYLDALPSALSGAKSGDPDLKHTMVGGMVVKLAGPGNNVPPPKQMIPPNTIDSETAIQLWTQNQSRILDAVHKSAGLNLNETRIQNPFVKFLKFNLYDVFEILVVHTERHVLQIEERAPRVKAGTEEQI